MRPSIAFARRTLWTTALVTSFVSYSYIYVHAQRPKTHTETIAHAEAKSELRPAGKPKPIALTQDDFDVLYYKIDVDLDPGTQTVSGSVYVRASVTSLSLATVEIDLYDNMTVSGVLSDITPVGFVHAGDLVTVTLERTYNQGEVFEIHIDYSGTPLGGSFVFTSHNSKPMIWSLSEPYGARSWWPCKDVPSDKADSVTVVARVPSPMIVASNGNNDDTVFGLTHNTWTWTERYPITTYLVSITAYEYTVWYDYYHHSPTDSMPVQFFAFPDHVASVLPAWDFTVPMLEAYAPMYGEYPFIDEKYGHAEFPWGGGMEHQTCSSMIWFGGEYLVSHELVHQWFGDLITCQSFHHIWLNEGFATYGEALWSEDQYGTQQYHDDMTAAKYFGPGTVFVADTTSVGRIFDSGLSYNKGSWVLHMLRHVVGDATFFDILRQYVIDFAYDTATTEDFQAVCETKSGMGLDWFFQEWIYGEYYPQYSYSWSSVPLGGGQWEVTLDIDQLQTNQIFKMPIDVSIGDETFVVWDSLASQTFTLTAHADPTEVLLDKDEWILRTIQQQITDPTFHRGVLVVNGVDYNTYGTAISTAYADSAFSGCYPITFWDHFNQTVPSWYPSSLPAPIGNGAIPADTLKQFSVVIWVGNNFNGDLASWFDTPIYSYLENGGDVLLVSRLGDDFINGTLQDYLGITWAETDISLGSCNASYPGLSNITISGSQNLCALFDTTFATPETSLLFETNYNLNLRGIGAWRKPADGGIHRANRGNFAFISGRPYRYDHFELRANIEYILQNLFGEPKVPVSVHPDVPDLVNRLEQNYPNPFNPSTTIAFTLAQPGPVTLGIYNVAGARVRTLVNGPRLAGIPHRAVWDGRNDAGQRVSSGVYFYRLDAVGFTKTRKLVMLK